ncbi:hypothetical protein K7472_31635 [Streptomyces sp. PTM05]|uniref:Diacylglycerol O-acyltransferase n=1 Tax=Streptantibioticus parmotrematis TaxID=2873249 RepID=A0ABS7R1N9_9ACTN|nr:hypothetical protein [Streptantibioticus parmotrematis]MBY8889361.1 hypothetical protein [Streptantibioticus parmotrematis]
MSPRGTWRLGPTDEMLRDSARALGSARTVQLLWRFPEPVDATALDAEWRRLDRGRLSRRIVPAAVPGARDRWAPAHNEEPAHHDDVPLTDGTVRAWLDDQVRAPLPVDSGALWRLAAAPYRTGSLVSLCVPHFRCDGMGLFRALAERTDPPAPRRRTPGPLAEDLADAAAGVAATLTRTPPWAAGLLAHPERLRHLAEALRPAGPAPAASAPRYFSWDVFEVDAAAWEERARAHGGTVNSLFVEIAANLVRAAVPRDAEADVAIGVPVDRRTSPDDGRANALVVVPVTVAGGPPRHDGLHPTRRATRAALADPRLQAATLVPERLWHLLPGGLANALKTPGAQQTDAVASNFGAAPEAVTLFAGAHADAVALRTMNVPGVVPERARLRASLCLLRTGDRFHVTVTGMPDHFGDGGTLHRLAREEFAAWDLPARGWWEPLPQVDRVPPPRSTAVRGLVVGAADRAPRPVTGGSER